MKRIIVLLVGAMMVGTSSAQVVQAQEAAMVYYSPKTEVTVDFIYTIETQEAGPFAEYAEELLGASDYVAENKKTYTLKEASLGTRTTADMARPHKVNMNAGIPILLSINEKGILKGYNLPIVHEKRDSKHQGSKDEGVKSRIDPIFIAPYTEEILKATDSTSMAETVAQQILHLRETRSYLLNGEVEHAPADGSSMKQVLAELDKQEKALTELFIGKRSSRTEQIRFTVHQEQNEQLLYFSSENGFTEGENIDADTIHIYTSLHAQTYALPQGTEALEVTPKSKKSKNGEESTQPKLSPIVYNLPGSADVIVVYQNRKLAIKTLPIAQAGIDIPLPMCLFTGETLPVILFNEKTGNVISISK